MTKSNSTFIGLSIFSLIATIFTVTPAQAAVFNVKTFGAVGNGSTDDTAAIRLAIGAAMEVPSDSTVEFPAGTYRYTGPLTIGFIKLKGVGGASLLSANTNAEVDITGPNSEIRDLTFVNVLPGGDAIKVTSNNFVIENNTFIRGFQHDIAVHGVTGGTISKNTINVSQIDHAIGVLINQSSKTITVSGNTMVSGDVTESTHTHGVHVESSSNIMLTGNGCTKLYSAIVVEASQKVTVQSNSTSKVQFSVVGTFNTKETVASNNFSGLSALGGAGIFDSASSTQTIRDNVIKSTLDGIRLTESTGPQIMRNQVSKVTGTGIDVETGETVVVSDNTVDTAKLGINLFAISGGLAEKNQLNNIQTNAIFSSGASAGTTTITDNLIMNAGLSLASPTPPAVIYVNSPSASGIEITENSYVGGTRNLLYYIWCVQGPPQAEVHGNTTNTMLPNRIGS